MNASDYGGVMPFPFEVNPNSIPRSRRSQHALVMVASPLSEAYPASLVSLPPLSARLD